MIQGIELVGDEFMPVSQVTATDDGSVLDMASFAVIEAAVDWAGEISFGVVHETLDFLMAEEAVHENSRNR